MSERDTKIPGHPEGLPPELLNDEQEDEGAQAQDVAADAMREDSHTTSPLESTKPESRDYDPAPDSKGDLVDEMNRMEGEGRIDMSAFAGEPNHDDEPETYGGETTDDDDEEWLTADGEELSEEDDEEVYDGDDDPELEALLEDVDLPDEDDELDDEDEDEFDEEDEDDDEE